MGCKFPSIQGHLHLMGDIVANCDSGAEADAMANGSLNIPLRILLRCLKFHDMNIPPLSL